MAFWSESPSPVNRLGVSGLLLAAQTTLWSCRSRWSLGWCPCPLPRLQSPTSNCKALSAQLFLECLHKPHYPKSINPDWEACSKMLHRHSLRDCDLLSYIFSTSPVCDCGILFFSTEFTKQTLFCYDCHHSEGEASCKDCSSSYWAFSPFESQFTYAGK